MLRNTGVICPIYWIEKRPLFYLKLSIQRAKLPREVRLRNAFFCNIGPDLASKVPKSKLHFELTPMLCTFEWGNRITVDEVIKEIDKLDTSKSSGIPSLSTKILKECLAFTVVKFTHLLNICIEKGVFPDKWKRAIVVPIPKGLNSKEIKNILPISLLPSPGKILKSFILRRMNSFLLENGLLCSEQSGFRKNFGTFDPITELLSYVNDSFNKGNIVICIFVDMTKACNCLDWHSS